MMKSMNGSPQEIDPPKWPLKLLRYVLKQDYLEEIEGDMEEVFRDNLECYSPQKASRLYTWETLKLLRPVLVKNLEERYQTTQYGMLKNYLKVAFRILRKEKTFAFINISGLALAIACSLFIYLWVQDELNFNQHLKDGDRICYVFGNDVVNSGDTVTYPSSSYLLKDFMVEHYPEIEQSAIFSWGNWMAFEKGDMLMEKEGTDASIEAFDMFEIEFVQGGYESMKDNMMTIALAESFADAYFGDRWKNENVVGEVITNEHGQSFEITGIFKNLPKSTDLKFEFVIPHEYRLSQNEWLNEWGNSGSRLFVKLAKGVTAGQANDAVWDAINEGRNAEDDRWHRTIFLQPFKDTYLNNRFANGKPNGGRIEYVQLLSYAAILILLLASINFMNMATARSAKRAKETGVRKVLGAFGLDLKGQFFTESVLITLFGLIVALALVVICLPQFNVITDKEVTLDFFTPAFLTSLLGFVIVVGVISGFYPAMYLSSIKTVVSLKGGHKHSKKDKLFRKSLVVFQFMITVFMISGAIAVNQQVSHIQNMNIGLDRFDLIRSWAHEIDPVKDFKVFQDELLKRPGIESVTFSSQDPIDIGSSTGDPKWQGKLDEKGYDFYIIDGMPELIPTLKMELVDGRNFSWNTAMDTANVIINQEAMRLMGLIDPVGMDLEMWGRKGKIIGVVRDFNSTSLHKEMQPVIIRFDPERTHRILTRAKPGETEVAIASLEEVYHMFNPKREFNYDFMDDMFNNYYKSELMVKDLSYYFTVLAIVISCMGLFALVAYTAEQKTKEIGIRKVLGASFGSILGLLTTEFLWLLMISLFVAIPLTFYSVSAWLDGFAYRISLSWWLFGLSGILTLLISFGIIGGHAIRSALTNPVESLRDE